MREINVRSNKRVACASQLSTTQRIEQARNLFEEIGNIAGQVDAAGLELDAI
jgi:hypothetical protein